MEVYIVGDISPDLFKIYNLDVVPEKGDVIIFDDSGTHYNVIGRLVDLTTGIVGLRVQKQEKTT
jgi:hypothetical protein